MFSWRENTAKIQLKFKMPNDFMKKAEKILSIPLR